MSIPYYDSADGRLLNLVRDATAQRYLAGGVARAVRRRNGGIVRLYSVTHERVHVNAGAIHAAASQTTQRIRDDGGVLIAPPLMREHRSERRSCA